MESTIDPLLKAGSAAGSDEFRIVSIDQSWTAKRCVASRESWGMAQRRDLRIIASDRRDDELLALCRNAVASATAMLAQAASLTRIVCRVIRERATLSTETTVVLSRGTLSVVTTLEHWAADDRLLQGLANLEPLSWTPDDRPLLWCHGSAAVGHQVSS